MKKLFPSINKKQRGVALVFTLGILGLLTVIALGFASTALINRKVAENCSNISYAQTIARSIALPRAMYAVRNIAALEQFYSTSTTTPTYDWLWKLDTSINGVQLFTYKYDNTATNKPTWVFVRDTTDNNRILGRYAYVVVPDKGRLDPSVNINDPGANGIIGLSENEIGLNNSGWATSLKAALDASPSYRWTTFWEILNKLGVSKTEPTWINFFTKGINIGQLKSPETYWVDSSTNPNIKDKEELFLRFNLRRPSTDWEAMTPEKLVGETPVGTEKKYWDNPDGSINFIPWLKDWHEKYKDDSDKEKAYMAKQTAANIIQYNTPNPDTLDAGGGVAFETVSDKMNQDWSLEANAPSYAGVGRHPSLNEIGFGIKVTAEVSAVPDDAANPTSWTYTPKYTFTVMWGAELINLFGVSNNKSTVRLPQVSVEADVKHFIDTVDPNTSNIDDIVASESLPKRTFKTSESGTYDGGTPFPEFRIDFAASDWLSTIAYTSKDKFWQSALPLKTMTLPSFILNGTANRSAEILNHMEVMRVRFKPGNAIMYYGDLNALGFKAQRDFAKLSLLNESDYTNVATMKAQDTCFYWMSLEANDPRVNHYPSSSNWKIRHTNSTLTSSSEAPNLYGYTESSSSPNHVGSIVNHTNGDDHLNSNVSASDIHVEDPSISDPAYQESGTAATRLASSYIRHEPMTSLWELSVISRAEAWKTLNLSVKDFSSTSTKDYSYANGDAVLLDQIKLNTEDQRLRYGKININTDVHQVWETLLDPGPFSFRKNLHTTQGNDLLSAGVSDANYPKIIKTSITPLPHTVTDCLACSLTVCTKLYSFKNRADLLVKPTNSSNLPGYSGTGLETALTDLQPLLKPETSAVASKVEKEQIFCKLAPLLKAEPADMVYVIILAQTIRDIGGTPAYIDWNGDNSYSGSYGHTDFDIMKKAGFVQTGETTSYAPSATSIPEIYTSTAVGTYEIGADKITSEAKLIAVLVQDPVTRKWRIARYQYVEQ